MDFATFLKAGKLRQKIVDIEGIGELVLTELSGKEAIQRNTEADEIAGAGMDVNHDHMRKWACRMLKGSMPTKAEKQLIKDNYSIDVVIQIYQNGLIYAALDSNSSEELEKN